MRATQFSTYLEEKTNKTKKEERREKKSEAF